MSVLALSMNRSPTNRTVPCASQFWLNDQNASRLPDYHGTFVGLLHYGVAAAAVTWDPRYQSRICSPLQKRTPERDWMWSSASRK